jgi:hypothetical protein
MTLASSRPTGEALLSLLSPFWELVIGGCALLVTGVARVAIAALDFLIQAR